MSDTRELPILEGYAAWAPFYDDDGNPLIAIEEPVMQAWYGPIEGRKILDLGCGTGRHTLPLAIAGGSIVAVDGSDEMLARAREKLLGQTIDWLRFDIQSPLPFEARSFDLIVLALVIEHVENLGALFTETWRLARPGGRMLVSTLHPDRTSRGQRARFIDPATGERRNIRTIHRSIEDYCDVARASGWKLEAERTLVVCPEIAEKLPRAIPYLGQNLGWASAWLKD